MAAHAERAMSVPPEVVFNTAIDPSRFSAWLPDPLRQAGSRLERTDGGLRACWRGADPDWSAELTVAGEASGGSRARLRLVNKSADQELAKLADEALTGLARVVVDNLTAG